MSGDLDRLNVLIRTSFENSEGIELKLKAYVIKLGTMLFNLFNESCLDRLPTLTLNKSIEYGTLKFLDTSQNQIVTPYYIGLIKASRDNYTTPTTYTATILTKINRQFKDAENHLNLITNHIAILNSIQKKFATTAVTPTLIDTFRAQINISLTQVGTNYISLKEKLKHITISLSELKQEHKFKIGINSVQFKDYFDFIDFQNESSFNTMLDKYHARLLKINDASKFTGESKRFSALQEDDLNLSQEYQFVAELLSLITSNTENSDFLSYASDTRIKNRLVQDFINITGEQISNSHEFSYIYFFSQTIQKNIHSVEALAKFIINTSISRVHLADPRTLPALTSSSLSASSITSNTNITPQSMFPTATASLPEASFLQKRASFRQNATSPPMRGLGSGNVFHAIEFAPAGPADQQPAQPRFLFILNSAYKIQLIRMLSAFVKRVLYYFYTFYHINYYNPSEKHDTKHLKRVLFASEYQNHHNSLTAAAAAELKSSNANKEIAFRAAADQMLVAITKIIFDKHSENKELIECLKSLQESVDDACASIGKVTQITSSIVESLNDSAEPKARMSDSALKAAQDALTRSHKALDELQDLSSELSLPDDLDQAADQNQAKDDTPQSAIDDKRDHPKISEKQSYTETNNEAVKNTPGSETPVSVVSSSDSPLTLTVSDQDSPSPLPMTPTATAVSPTLESTTSPELLKRSKLSSSSTDTLKRNRVSTLKSPSSNHIEEKSVKNFDHLISVLNSDPHKAALVDHSLIEKLSFVRSEYKVLVSKKKKLKTKIKELQQKIYSIDKIDKRKLSEKHIDMRAKCIADMDAYNSHYEASTSRIQRICSVLEYQTKVIKELANLQ